MSKLRSTKIFSCVICSAVFCSLSINSSVFASSQNDTESMANIETIANIAKKEQPQRIRKQIFGQKGKKGEDYAGESTAGVGGATAGGLQSVDSDEFKDMKNELYKDSPEVKNDDVINTNVNTGTETKK
ncbi:MAG: hypothetical protein V2B14_00440 [bacterium]